MERPRFQVDIGTMMVATAVVALFVVLWLRYDFGLVTLASIPGASCVVATRALSRCGADGRRPSREDWDEAGADMLLIASGVMLLDWIVRIAVRFS